MDHITKIFVEWIKTGLKQKGKTQSGLAAHLHIAHPQITQLLQGNRGLKVNEVPRIADYLGIPSPFDNIAAEEIPLLAWVSAGSLQREDISDEQIGSIVIGNLPEGDWIALRVQGDSMDKVSPPDSIILVDRADKNLVPNGCYVIADEDGNATYKRYRPNPDRFEPVSMNDSHVPIIPDHMPPVVGRVRRSILEM